MIYLSFSKNKKMKLWYDSFGYDCLSIKDYYGPECFLENDFLIKAMMSEKEAYTLFDNYLKNK